jgi:hypothetical protein
MSMDLDFFGLTEEVASPIAHSLSTNRRGGDCWGVAKVGEGERDLDQYLATAKSGSILRLCHRRYHHGYALAEGMERGVVGDKGWCGIRGVGLSKAGGTDKGLCL